MPEKPTPARAVFVNFACDECGEPMKATGQWTRPEPDDGDFDENGLLSRLAPAAYDHTCPNGHKTTLFKQYPLTRIVEEPNT